MLYYRHVVPLKICSLQLGMEVMTLMTPEQVAASPYVRRSALDPFRCTADLSDRCGWRIGSADVDNGLDTRPPPRELRPALYLNLPR